MVERFVFQVLPSIPNQGWSPGAPTARGRASDALFALLFPSDCQLCSHPIESFTRVPVCDDCLRAVRAYQGTECARCGLFLQSAVGLHGTGECGLCRRGAFAFEQARSFAWYEGALRDLIQLLKYKGYRPLAKPLANCLAEAMKRLETAPADWILPVPLHPRRQRQRGFNQAALLAERLSKLCRLPFGGNSLLRVRDTPPQTGLRAADRRKNVAGAFRVPEPQRVRSRRFLLVDDVLTTGATANACAEALRAAGAESVAVLTLARAHPARDDV